MRCVELSFEADWERAHAGNIGIVQREGNGPVFGRLMPLPAGLNVMQITEAHGSVGTSKGQLPLD